MARPVVPSVSSSIGWSPASLPLELSAVKQALERVRQRRPTEAAALAKSISDPVAQKLVEWALLRHPDSEARFERYVTFIRANPDWPSIPLLRRRAEMRLWQKPRRIEDLLHMSSGPRIRAPQDPDYDPSGPYPDHLSTPTTMRRHARSILGALASWLATADADRALSHARDIGRRRRSIRELPRAPFDRRPFEYLLSRDRMAAHGEGWGDHWILEKQPPAK
jgi:hypothetical protein